MFEVSLTQKKEWAWQCTPSLQLLGDRWVDSVSLKPAYSQGYIQRPYLRKTSGDKEKREKKSVFCLAWSKDLVSPTVSPTQTFPPLTWAGRTLATPS